MEGPLEEANLVRADSTRLDSGQLEAKSTTNRRKIRFEVSGQMDPSLPNRLSSPVSESLAKACRCLFTLALHTPAVPPGRRRICGGTHGRSISPARCGGMRGPRRIALANCSVVNREGAS